MRNELRPTDRRQGDKATRNKQVHYSDMSAAKAGNQIGSGCFFLDILQSG